MLTIKHNIPEIKNKLLRLKTLIGEHPNFQDDIKNQLEKARKLVQKKTPKSSGSGSQVAGTKKKPYPGHLAGGWILHTIGGSGKDRIPLLGVIYNKYTTDMTGKTLHRAKLKSGSGQAREYSLLQILEYGSRPHVIKPRGGFTLAGRRAKALHFVTKEGAEVFTKVVHHPGTKPYGMVRITRAKLQFWLTKLKNRWENKFKQEWAK